MRWLLFLSRLGFICGLFFLASITLLYKDWLTDQTAVSMVVTIGYTMGLVVFPLVNLCYILIFLVKRKLRPYVSLWLIIPNLFFLLVLIYFIFYLNDPYYHQK